MKVNEGATLNHWTDRHAGTVTWVSLNGRTLKWQRDVVTRTDNNGMSEAQKYSYECDTSTYVFTFTKRKNGMWYKLGEKMGTSYLTEGRHEYYDFSF